MKDAFETIRGEVVEAGGLKCFKMQTLREASPYKKLGPGVNKELSAALQQKSLGHSEMPPYQNESVYVYEQGSDAAKLFNAIMGVPSEGGANEILKSVEPDSEANTAEKMLKEVKALVIEMNDIFAA